MEQSSYEAMLGRLREQPAQEQLVHNAPVVATEVIPATSDREQLQKRSARKALAAAGAVLVATAAFGVLSDNDEANKHPVVMLHPDGINPTSGHESAIHIAQEGTCSPYNHADMQAVANGEMVVTQDLVDAEVDFLNQNPEFAANYGQTSVDRIGFLWDSLGLERPGTDDAQAAEAMIGVFEHENFTTAPLAESVPVMNTYCDSQGNVIDYRAVTLEAGTYVGGQQIMGLENGQVVFASGERIVLPPSALVVRVLVNGESVSFLATHKAGIDTDGDPEAEIGCLNVLTRVPEGQPPVTDTTIPTETTIVITTTPTTTPETSEPRVVVTPPASTPIQGRGPGGEPDEDDDPENNTTVRPNPTTATTAANTTTTEARSVTSTTLGACGEACE